MCLGGYLKWVELKASVFSVLSELVFIFDIFALLNKANMGVL